MAMRPTVIEFPNDLEIVTTRELEAPIQLVFDVMTKPEHVSKTIAPFRERVTVCSFRDKAGRDHMTRYDGLEANFDNVEALLRSLLHTR
jgi:uncharacterized protein YndB with AHSA1/START domain